VAGEFFGFVTENAGATFYHATTARCVQIIYCRDKDKGMWFNAGNRHGTDAAERAWDFEADVEGR